MLLFPEKTNILSCEAVPYRSLCPNVRQMSFFYIQEFLSYFDLYIVDAVIDGNLQIIKLFVLNFAYFSFNLLFTCIYWRLNISLFLLLSYLLRGAAKKFFI